MHSHFASLNTSSEASIQVCTFFFFQGAVVFAGQKPCFNSLGLRSSVSIWLLEIRDSLNLAKLGQGCTTKLSDGDGEGIEFRFNWWCGWVATMVPNWEFRSTFWLSVASM